MLLRDKDRRTLCEIFETSPLPIEVWAYGSRVNGTAHDASDLDLVVRTFAALKGFIRLARTNPPKQYPYTC